MVNTVMTAKNSFEEGLVMDLSPDNTSANTLTSALNATLITFNGNEMQLQNDMGNGRVETAYLPDGYIPMGTCEFGDIIYIVSYNPLTDKAQIGCFPSPERNISSDEISENKQSLNSEDFQIMNGGEPTGDLKSTSVKKVLIETKKLNPGDKYIIYTNQADSLTNNADRLSDYGMGKHNVLPKYVKLHVVSIEDSGKITYLDTTTKWYNDFYIKEGAVKVAGGKTDLDSYRDLTSSEWSIFSSKVSGKLAILAELEMIDSFSCSYNLNYIRTDIQENIKYKVYDLQLVPSYSAKEGLTLPYLCVTQAAFNTSKLESNTLKNDYVIEDFGDQDVYYYDTNNNKYVVYKGASSLIANKDTQYAYGDTISVATISIPYQQLIGEEWSLINSASFIYNLEIVPAMKYGRLDQYKIQLSIDFNKVGTGEVAITNWKYHNSGKTSILSYGIDAYPKPNWTIDSVIMHFYDNQGLVGEYLLNDRHSYTGVFTEYLGLDGESINSRFSRNNSLAEDPIKSLIKHKGNIVDTIPAGSHSDDYCVKGDTHNGVTFDDNYINDAGTLYANYLYAVKIIINQSLRNDEGKVISTDSRIEYRWFWTTSMFNEYYYSVKDFNILNFELILNGEVLYESNPATYIWKQQEVNNLGNSFNEKENSHFKTYSANIQYIGKEPNGALESNINMYVKAGLQENYGCFNLYNNKLSEIDLDIYLSTGKILYSFTGDGQYQFSDKETNVTDPEFLRINTVIKENGNGTNGFKYLEGTALNADKVITEEQYINDDFNITFSNGATETKVIQDDEGYNPNCQIIKTTLDQCYYASQNDKKSIPLTLAATLFNKAYTQNIYNSSVQVPVYLPLINSLEDMKSFGITYYNPKDTPYQLYLGFNSGMNLSQTGTTFSSSNFTINEETLQFTGTVFSDDSLNKITKNVMVNTGTDQDFITNIWGMFSSSMPTFFPVYFGGDFHTDRYNVLSGNTPKNYAKVSSWQTKRAINVYDGNKINDYGYYSRLTGGEDVFDIKDYKFSGIKNNNHATLLGMHYKEGMTLLNTAMVDSYDSTNNYFKQQDVKRTTGEYDNFAYQLYLILSNTYHKDKRAEDQEISIKNHVRNSDYDIQLIKNIIIHLKPKEGVINNILMQGMDFITYTNTIKALLLADNNNFNAEAIEKNITLKFLDYAHNSQLQINVKNSPMSFLSTDSDAFILKNGSLKGTNVLGSQFYVYQGNDLEVFQNKPLLFKKEDVIENIKYVLGDSISDQFNSLPGAPLKQTTEKTNYEEAYNYYLSQIGEFIASFDQYGINLPYQQYLGYQDAKDYLMYTVLQELVNYVSDKFEILSEDGTVIDSFSKEYILDEMYTEGVLCSMSEYETSMPSSEPFYWIQKYEYNGTEPQCWRIQVNPTAYMGKEKSHIVIATHYEVNQYLNLNKFFKYDNGLVLDSSMTHDNFGITDVVRYDYGYCGFLEDIVLDKNYQLL